MKYKNHLVNLLRGEEMLHFMQQFSISIDFRRGMLHLMQDFKPPTYQKAKMTDVPSGLIDHFRGHNPRTYKVFSFIIGQPENLRLASFCEYSRCWRQVADSGH